MPWNRGAGWIRTNDGLTRRRAETTEQADATGNAELKGGPAERRAGQP